MDNIGSLLYQTNVMCHFPLLCGWVGGPWFSYVEQADRKWQTIFVR